MKRRHRSFLLVALLLMFCFSCSYLHADYGKTYPYGTKIKYLDNGVKKLPDFSIQFLGSISSPSTDCPTDCAEYDFEVVKGAERKGFTWRRQRNDIEPWHFEIGGEEYVLEVGGSRVETFPEKARMGWHEMIVWKKAEYERRPREKGMGDE